MAEAALFDGDASAYVIHGPDCGADPCHRAGAGTGREWTAWGLPAENLPAERSVCVNTAAAGGNASLMTIG